MNYEASCYFVYMAVLGSCLGMLNFRSTNAGDLPENYPEIRQYDLVHQTEQYNLSNAARAWIPQLAFSAQATWQTDAPNFPKELTGMLAQQGLENSGD